MDICSLQSTVVDGCSPWGNTGWRRMIIHWMWPATKPFAGGKSITKGKKTTLKLFRVHRLSLAPRTNRVRYENQIPSSSNSPKYSITACILFRFSISPLIKSISRAQPGFIKEAADPQWGLRLIGMTNWVKHFEVCCTCFLSCCGQTCSTKGSEVTTTAKAGLPTLWNG